MNLGLFVPRAGALDHDTTVPPKKTCMLKARLAHRTWWHLGALGQEGLHLTLPNQLQGWGGKFCYPEGNKKIWETRVLTASKR